MVAILSSLMDLAEDLLSGRDWWPLLLLTVVALTMTFTGLTARMAVWLHDKLAPETGRVPGSPRLIV